MNSNWLTFFLVQIFLSNPVRSNYNYEYPLQCFCNSSSTIVVLTTSVNTSLPNYSCHECFPSPISGDETPLPNKALLSFIILLGTCFIAVALKRFRRSKFFGRTVSQEIDEQLIRDIKLSLSFFLVKTNLERFRNDHRSDFYGAIRYVGDQKCRWPKFNASQCRTILFNYSH